MHMTHTHLEITLNIYSLATKNGAKNGVRFQHGLISFSKNIEVRKMNINIVDCKNLSLQEEDEEEELQHPIHQSIQELHQGVHQQDSTLHLHQKAVQAVAKAEITYRLEIGINTEPEIEHQGHQKGVHLKEACH